MHLYHALQLLVSAWVIVLAVRGTRALLWKGDLDASAFLRVLRRLPDDAAKQRLIAAALPAWIARSAEAALCSEEEAQEVISDLQFEAGRWTWALRVLGRVSSALGLLGAVAAIFWLVSFDHGLLALRAGLPERLAIESALLSVGIGFATGIVARSAAAHFAATVKRFHRESRGVLGLSGLSEMGNDPELLSE